MTTPVTVLPRSGVFFTPIYGVQSSDPLCLLLDIHGFRVLLDCGWSELMDTALVEPLRALAPMVHAVLLSHASMEHCGALPYAYGKLGLRAPLYCTAPVHKLAMLLLYDQYLSRRAASDFNLFTLDDIDSAFEKSVRLKYLQPQALGDERLHISVTAYPSGHLLGGAMWRVTVSGEELLFVAGVNHRVERVFVRSALQSFSRPAVVVADARSALQPPVKRSSRDAELQQAVLGALQEGGSVLMPVDATGRVLELLVHLEELWEEEKLEFPVFFLSHVSSSMVEFVKGMLEWLNDVAAREFDQSRINPFNFKYVRLCNDLQAVEQLPGPKVVLCSLSSLEAGFSRELFSRFAPDLRNTLLFTARAAPGTLAHTMQTESLKVTFPVLQLVMSSRVDLEGEELQQFLDKQRQEEAQKEQQQQPKEEEGEQEGEGERAGQAVLSSQTTEGVAQDGKDIAMEVKEEGKQESGTGTSSIEAESGNQQAEEEEDEEDSLQSLPLPPLFLEGLTPSGSSASGRSPAAAVGAAGWGGPSVAPVFPFREEEQRWDEFGLVIDEDAVADLMLPSMQAVSRAVASTAEREAAADAANVLSRLERPSKVVSRSIMVKLHCAVKFVDYEGLADGRSLRTMLTHVAPQRLVLVHGSKEASAQLQQEMSAELGSEVLAPERMRTIDLTADLATAKVSLKLSEEFMRTVLFTELPGGYAAAYVDTEIHVPPPLPPDTDADGASVPEQLHQTLPEEQQREQSAEQQQQQPETVDGEAQAGPLGAEAMSGVEVAGEPTPPAEQRQPLVGKEEQEGEEGRERNGGGGALALVSGDQAVPSGGVAGGLALSASAIALSLQPQPPLLLSGVREEGTGHRREAVFVGDPKLSDLKGLLESSQGDYQAVFSTQEGAGGAVLRCGPHVALRKASDQQVVLEGSLSEQYFGARELVYSQYGIL